MRRHLRRLRWAAGLLVLSVAGCGAGAEPPQGEGAVGGRIRVQVAGSDSELRAVTDLVVAFEQAHEGTRVQIVPVPSADEHVAKLATAFAAGRPPDVFLLNYRRFGQFAARGVIAPAQDRLGALALDDFYAPPLAAFTVDGTLLCLPQNVSSSVIYLNLDLFRAAGVPVPRPGWTWADMTATARALAARDVEAVAFEVGTRTVAPFVWGAGGEMVDDPDAPTRMTLDDDYGRAAMRFLLGLQATGFDANQRAAEDPEVAFARGEVAMFYDSRRAVPALREVSELDFDVVPLPAGREQVSLLASDAYCVAEQSENIATAAAFSRFAVGPDGGRILAETGRTVPSLKVLAESESFLAPGQRPASARVFLDAIPTLRQLPNVAAQGEAEEVADEIFEQMFAGRLTLDEALKRIEADTAVVYSRDS